MSAHTVLTHTVEKPPFAVTHARVVGLLMLLPVPLGIFGSRSSDLVVPGDPAASADNILASESLFRLQTVSTLLLLIADAFLLVLVFYPLFKPVHRNLALLMMTLNLLGVATAMLNELNQFAIVSLLHGTESPGQLQALSLLLSVHETGSLIAGLFWGLWLVPYAILVFRSGFLPKFFAALLLIECGGFLIQSFAGMLASSPSPDLAMLPAVTSLAELFLPLWMIAKGINVQRWARHTGGFAVATTN